MSITYLGWTQRQWGIAIKRLGHRPTSLDEAKNMRVDWQRKKWAEPGEVQIHGGDYSSDLQGGGNVLRMALNAGRAERTMPGKIG